MDPDYELFAAVVEAGSLSAAGRALDISTAMVSKRLRRLEKRLSVSLLVRSTRRMALTPDGEQFLGRLRPILAALREAEAAVRGDRTFPRGRLRVSAPTSFGRMHLAPHLGAFLDRYPQLHLSLDLSDEFVDLSAGSIDLALRITSQLPRGFTSHRLATSRRVLCAAPRYLRQYGAPQNIKELRTHKLIAARGQLPWNLSSGNRHLRFEGCSGVETNSSEVVRELTVAGFGIALRSLWDVDRELASGKLQRILPAWEGSADVAIFAVHRPQAFPNATLDAFITFLRELHSPKPPWERST